MTESPVTPPSRSKTVGSCGRTATLRLLVAWKDSDIKMTVRLSLT